MHQPYQLNVPPISPFDRNSWDEVQQAFSGVESCALGQAWFDRPVDLFRPAKVRAGWISDADGGALWVLAELDDLDIFNSATGHNEHTWLTGDVFEMFLRPLPTETYYELHVTPENNKLQLRIPNSLAMSHDKSVAIPLDQLMVAEPIFYSRTLVLAGEQRWLVLAAVPGRLAPTGKISEGDQWLFSWSRYDYTRGREDFVNSSTSPHQKLNFHRQEEWGTLTFKA